MELSDHVAIVTGAGQGIGKAAALALALALAGRVNRRKSNGAARTCCDVMPACWQARKRVVVQFETATFPQFADERH